MIKRKFIPKIGMKVYIIKNVCTGLEPKDFREPRTISDFYKVPVDGYENGFVYQINLIENGYLFTEEDLEPA